jgi:ankyrin repeat protein
LLDHGADPNKRITYRSPVDGRVERGVVALMVAASPEVVTLLLRAGADATVQDEAGRTVLMRLVGAAPSETFDLLIRAGADRTARAVDGTSAADLVRKRIAWWRRFAHTANTAHQRDLEAVLAMLEG